jgi:hypothetical protein
MKTTWFFLYFIFCVQEASGNVVENGGFVEYFRIVEKKCLRPNSLVVDGIEYCKTINTGPGPAFPRSEAFVVSFPYVVRDEINECYSNHTCSENEDVITETTSRFFRCVCKENFYKIQNTCQKCSFGKFSPIFSNRLFECPEHSSLTNRVRDSTSYGNNVNDFQYCQADPGYKIVPNFRHLSDLLEMNNMVPMYSVEKCEKCYKKTICNTSLVVVGYKEQIPLPCEPGFFKDADSDECSVCLLNSFCLGTGSMQTCGANSKTLHIQSPSKFFCICADAGVVRNTTDGTCIILQGTTHYSPICSSNSKSELQWCEKAHPCPLHSICSNGTRTECLSGQYIEQSSKKCRVCPRGHYCQKGFMRKCPHGAVTQGQSAHNSSFCHCLTQYVHRTDVSLVDGFYCQARDRDKQKAIVVDRIHRVSTFDHSDIVYHVKQTNSESPQVAACIIFIQSTELKMTLHFINEYKIDGNSSRELDLMTVNHLIARNDFPFPNSEIVSATFQNNRQQYGYEITLSMLITNKYDGIVFSGLISGFVDFEGVFEVALESWILQYDFSDAIRYNLLQAEGMHVLFAVQSLDVQMNASSTSYNALCINEYSGLLRTHTITVQSLYNNENEMYENDESQFSAYIDPDHRIAMFVKPDGLVVSLDTVSCELMSPESSILIQNNIDTLLFLINPSMHVDIFDAFHKEYVLFIDPVKYEFGVLQVVYEDCGENEYADLTTGFACACSTNYQKKTNSHVCVLCNMSSPACCHNSVECEMKMNKCQSGFRLSENEECILCDQTSYCIGSEEFKCAENSITLNRGSYQNSDCVCTAGLFQSSSGCEPCPFHFFCRDNMILKCPTHMQTTKSGARDESDCFCTPGYFMYTSGGDCEEVPHGSYWGLDTATQQGNVYECPMNSTTAHLKSITQSSCRCAPGFKQDTENEDTCVECVGDNEACLFDSIVVLCNSNLKLTSSPKHDNCVCISGYFRVPNNDIQCEICPPGYYCTSTAVSPISKCPSKMTSLAGATSVVFCFCQNQEQLPHYNKQLGQNECRCNPTFYSQNNRCIQCPSNMFVPSSANDVILLEGISTCVCMNGYMFQNGECVRCMIGYFCNNGRINSIIPCPFGKFSPISGLSSSDECLSCGDKNISTVSEWNSPRTSVLTCLGDFVVFDSNVNINLHKSVYVFSVNTDDLQTQQIIEMSRIIFGVKSFDITYTYMKNKITYTITMQPEFIVDAMSILLSNPRIWATVVVSSTHDPMSYIYIAHRIFCLFFSAVSHEVYSSDSDTSVCYVPFHISKLSMTPGVLQISTEFMKNKLDIFKTDRITMPNTLMFNELSSIYNTLNYVFDTKFSNPLIVVPISGNALAVFRNDNPFDLQNMARKKFERLLQIQVSTEHVLTMVLGDCQLAVKSLFGTCVFAPPSASNIVCSYCEPDVAYFDQDHQKCVACSPAKTPKCIACCEKSDTQCLDENTPQSVQQLCGNAIHDFSEECDSSDLNSPLHTCCTNCKLNIGYYQDPPCSTRCGDFQIAKDVEECDAPGDFTCDMYTCRKIYLQMNTEL